ncbi:hypothetical protein [Actinophytocola sp. NPDC049390]|uniref:hypothetical protein n=1 Tax=Actinophytocola sp. NPDC049390 TaxID=3363894 RepID=UPI00378C8FB8
MARVALAALLACVLALAGCASLADLGKLQQDLDAAGYNATSVNHNTTNGNSVLSIGIAMPDAVPTEEDGKKVAEIVWKKYPGEFDHLVVNMNGAILVDATPEDLTAEFGDRPAGLTEESEDGADRGGSSALTIILILAGAAVFAGLMVLLWYRGRRPPPPVAPPPGYQYQPPGGHFQYPPRPPQG